MSNAQRLSPRVFLEGVEVPCQGVDISASVNQSIECTINLIPGNYAKKIVPRTLVHVFVQDPYGEPDKWFLAFEGEFVAKQYNKTANSKTFIATAVDFTSYYDSAKSYFFNPRFGGMSTTDIEQLKSIVQQMQNAPKNQSFISSTLTAGNFMLTLMNQELTATGEVVDAVRKALAECSKGNAFLRLAETRLRIADRLISETAGAGLKAALGKTWSGTALDNLYNDSVSGVVTLRELVMTALQFMFHDMIVMPFPSLVTAPSSVKATLNGKTIASVLIKPSIHFLPPPKCNVVFPSMYTSLTYSHNYLNDITRLIYKPELVAPSIGGIGQAYTYYPDSYARFMGRNPKDTTDENSPLAIAKVYGDVYKNKMSSKKRGEEYGDDKSNVLAEQKINSKLRDNDFLTNEEAVRGITEEMIGNFPGIAGIITGNSDSSENKSYFDKIAKYLFFKKRFEHRTLPLNTSYNPHLAIGFPIVVIDETDSVKNTIVGYLEGVRHSFSPTSAETSLMITYARELDETEELTGLRVEPPMPPWFDPARWGEVDTKATEAETKNMSASGYKADAEARKSGVIQFDKISDTYQKLLGVDSITHSKNSSAADKRRSTEGAVASIIIGYKNAVAAGDGAEKDFVRKFIARPLVSMENAFLFINAVPMTDALGNGVKQDFLVFSGTSKGPSAANTFDGILTTAQKTALYGAGFEYLTDQSIIAKKREVVKNYANELKYSAGQRG